MQLPHAFGRYQLLERLAAGGMAEVFLARSFGAEGFEKRLVIKRILPELASNPQFVALFVHEAKLSVALNHPNVVTVFDLGKVGSEPYIAMEHIHGRDLAQVQRALRAAGRVMPPDLAASVVASAARGLAYAHARRAPDGRPLHIVHRDVSPHNVIVSFEGAVKIVDFGIARLEGEAGGAHPGGGKYAYMSPEQAAGETIDARSDIFSLGVVLYELLAGRRLFADGEPEEKREAVIRCALPPMEELLPDAPAPLHRVLGRALARDRDARYPDAEALEEDLRAWLYASGWRGELQTRAAWLQALFPGEAERRSGLELERLVEDLQALVSPPQAGGDGVQEATHATTHAPGSDEGTVEATRNATQPVLERGERRAVAVLVVEVNGLTELSSRVEADEIARVHYRMLRAMRGVIDRLGGVADRFEEDTLTVLFGVPRATGDDVDRALVCARELHRLAARMRRRGVVVELSAGVHVGELSAAPAGRKTRWTPRGDTRKAAVRLAYLAEPGTTLASERVAALAADRFPFDRGPDLRGKGARGIRPTFALAGGPRVPTRNGIKGRWFRRGDEVEVLRGAIAQLREGRGSRIAVLGEAGAGKSRLFREFRDLAQRRGVPVFHGRAAAWGADAPLAPFRDLVADILGVRPDTPPAAIRERLGRLGSLGLEAADLASLASLFSLETGDAAEARGRHPARDALVSAGQRLLRGFASDGPVVLMLEDLQYLEPMEVDLLEQLLRAVEGFRVVVLASWRGDVPEALAPMLYPVRLGVLSREQSEGLAADLLDASDIGPDLAALVGRTAEGNPFYIEETVKALREAGRIYFEGTTARLREPERDPGLPPTLQGLIAARLDRLDTAARGALQVAAVIGPTFSPALLGAAIGAPEPHRIISELVRAGLVAPETQEADTGYTFSSVLVWECVLRSILGIQRRAYHRMIAAAMEQLYAGRMEAVQETFAAHAHAGGRSLDAARSLLGVVRGQRRAQLLERALDTCERARAWLRGDSRETPDPVLEAWLDLEAGELAQVLGRPRAESLLQRALEQEGPSEIEARALMTLGALYLEQSRLALARAHLEAAASAWRKLGDRPGQVRTCELLGRLALEERQPERAENAWREGLALAGDDSESAARMLLGMATHALRRDDNPGAEALLRRALPHAERANDRILLGRIVNNLGIVHVQEGRFEQAIVEFRRALEARAGLGYRHGEVVNQHNIADACFRLGDLARAWAGFEQSRELARACNWERGVAMNEVYLAFLRGLRGEDAAQDLEDARARCARAGDSESALLADAFAALLAEDPRRLRRVVDEARTAGFADLVRQVTDDLPQVEGRTFVRVVETG